MPVLKEKISGLGNSITIIKNLDEYQFLICKYIPILSDQNIFKFKFQKVRVLIFLFISKFTITLIENKTQSSSMLYDLNKSGNGILKETSELIQLFRSTLTIEKLNIDKSRNLEDQINLQNDYFIDFDHNESEVNKILFSIYGINIEDRKTENYGEYNDSDFDDEKNDRDY